MELKSLITMLLALFAALNGGGDGKKTDKKEKQEMSFVSVTSNGTNDILVVKKNSDPERIEINGHVIDGSELAVGESKDYQTKRGTVTLSRDEAGLELKDEDGKIVRLIGEGDEHGQIFAFGGEHFKMAPPEDTVVIQGLENLDEIVREKVRAALAEAGVDKEVVFTGEPHMVWVDDAEGQVQVNGHAIFVGGEQGDQKIKVQHIETLMKRAKEIKEQEEDEGDEDQ